jgi:hypothetical protein
MASYNRSQKFIVQFFREHLYNIDQNFQTEHIINTIRMRKILKQDFGDTYKRAAGFRIQRLPSPDVNQKIFYPIV